MSEQSVLDDRVNFNAKDPSRILMEMQMKEVAKEVGLQNLTPEQRKMIEGLDEDGTQSNSEQD